MELPGPRIPQRLPDAVKDSGIIRLGADAAQRPGVEVAEVDAGGDASVHPAEGQHLLQRAQLANLSHRLRAEGDLGKARFIQRVLRPLQGVQRFFQSSFPALPAAAAGVEDDPPAAQRPAERRALEQIALSSFGPVVALANLGASLTQVFASADRVLDLLDEDPVTADVTDGADTVFTGAQAEHVSFAYAKEEVLHDLSLTIPEKKIVGIMGRSGSGKSTFLRLLMRFWDVSSGTIRFGERDIRTVNTAALRAQESLVTQETELFDDTIENNIRIARRDATRAEVEAACRKAALDGFINSLPKGYDTPVGELGGALSGGERQRIGVARAFLHDAPFLLLDEPTSNLDSLNEGIILKAVRDECREKTVLLVSHRRSTMAVADLSFSVESGRLS